MGFADGPTPDRLAVCAATLAVLRAVADDGPVHLTAGELLGLLLS